MTRRRGVKNFNPDEPRDWHGRWGSGGGADVLKLAGRIHLDPGERLVSSSRFKDDSGNDVDLLFAVIQGQHFSEVRIGVIPRQDAKKWTAEAKGATAGLDSEELRQARADLAAAAGKADRAAAAAEKARAAGRPPTDPKLLGAEAIASGRLVSANHDDLDWAIHLNDLAAWDLSITPTREGFNGFSGDPLDTEALLKHLDGIQNELDRAPNNNSGKRRGARFHTSPRLPQKEGRVNAKSFSRVEIKSEDRGQVTAVFATFGVVDSDGDVTMPGAFQEGAEAPISQYGHTSWQGALPVGKGRIRTTGKEAIVEGQFFMDTTHGRDAFLTVKQLGSLGQWSYGYDVLDSEQGDFKGRQVRYLKQQLVHEFSPTLIGAGINTRTLSTKGRSPDVSGGSPMGFAFKAAIKPHDTQITTGAWDASAAVKSIAQDASVSDLRSMFAWVDSEADPEVKGSYKFPHHTGVGGPANVRACIAGIAALNGARGGASIPDADQKGVYSHLAQHLRDADREPPELRSGSADGLKFNDELSLVLCEVDNLIDRASEVVALRAKKGRSPLSVGSGELMEWLDTDLRRLKFLLTPTEDEAAIEYLRFLRSTLGEQTS